jgi:hypothetical protein
LESFERLEKSQSQLRRSVAGSKHVLAFARLTLTPRHHQNSNGSVTARSSRPRSTGIGDAFSSSPRLFHQHLPWMINLVYAAFNRYVQKASDRLVIESFIKSWAEFIWHMYPVLSLYTLILRSFRAELRKIFRCTVIHQVTRVASLLGHLTQP